MRKLLVIAAVLLVVVAGALVLFARGRIGGDTMRRSLERELSARLNEPVAIGQLGASFFPRVTVDLRGVSIGSAKEATIAELSIATGLRGLLSRRVEGAEIIVSNSRVPVGTLLTIAGGAGAGSTSNAPGGLRSSRFVGSRCGTSRCWSGRARLPWTWNHRSKAIASTSAD